MLERFGKYELLQRIASGGMAEVYLARTHGAQGFVKELVIKRILPQLNEDPDFVSMFINEARLAARLQHANIVQIYDFDHVGGDYYLAMELVDGADLRRIQATARRREMPLPRTLGIHVGIEALKGLHYAHTRQYGGEALGIVHRDISPHNLLLSFAGEVKVVDFGIAKVAALHSATKTGMVKGKLTYMAPEQLRGEPVDARTDLYALGIILWELLTGRRRYDGVGSEGELVAAARRGDAPPLAEILPDVEGELSAAVDRLLRPDPAERYASAAEALADLSRFSGATDSFEVSEYLRRLMPAGAERDRRGNTEIMGQGPPSVVAAPANAPTATMDRPTEDAAEGDGAEGDAAEGGADAVSGRQEAIAPPVDNMPERPRGALWLPLGVFLGCIIAAAALTFSLRSSGNSAGSAVVSDVVTLSLAQGGEVEGVPLSAGTIYGPRGQRLQLSLDAGAREVVLGASAPDLSPAPARSSPDMAPSVTPPRAARSADAGEPAIADAGNSAVKRVAARGANAGGRRSSKSAEGSSRGLAPSAKLRRKGRADPPKKRATTSKRGFGYLAVMITPWAWVQVDGGRRLQTPVTRLKLREGRHTLRLFNDELKKSETLKIAITKGQLKKIRRNW